MISESVKNLEKMIFFPRYSGSILQIIVLPYILDVFEYIFNPQYGVYYNLFMLQFYINVNNPENGTIIQPGEKKNPTSLFLY